MRFRPEERIRRRAEFKLVYEHGVRIHSRYSTVFILRNEHRVGRLGIAATRKLGGAVVIPKRDLLDASLSTLETDYRTLLERRFRSLR